MGKSFKEKRVGPVALQHPPLTLPNCIHIFPSNVDKRTLVPHHLLSHQIKVSKRLQITIITSQTSSENCTGHFLPVDITLGSLPLTFLLFSIRIRLSFAIALGNV